MRSHFHQHSSLGVWVVPPALEGAAAWVAVGAQPHLRAPSAGADSRM
jgi:hypothetical protein